ncbi:MAG: ornithine cyclodeaminase [Sneathiella sp.]|mgnify:FL=1|uniref:ornithine cyclodeaminase family protein n=1 Tax=Sneathiella sp. TaxID=1964365 RepID=UPI000C365E22|nr:ornithine cyclodeaminase family protein [Sneathiella sp.]MAZ02547.1 ornithine cyclodeaminase [Sneathiella sp.]
MRIIENAEVSAALAYPALIDALRRMFTEGCTQPLRHHHSLDPENEKKGTLLIMPAWQSGKYLGLKTVTVMPENGSRGLPSVQGTYLLFDTVDGRALAFMNAGELTTRRTASASALAASFLARKDSSRLLMVGAGAMAPCLVRAHAAVRPIQEVSVWNHRAEKAERLADDLSKEGFTARAVTDLKAAAGDADIISCATLSTEPLIHGDWLKPGVHVDLVGAFTPTMRETDDAAIRIANVFVDTREGGLNEAGDIVLAMKAGAFTEQDLKADLYDLCRDRHPGRTSDEEITLFKSTGAALEDLAAAILAYEANEQK